MHGLGNRQLGVTSCLSSPASNFRFFELLVAVLLSRPPLSDKIHLPAVATRFSDADSQGFGSPVLRHGRPIPWLGEPMLLGFSSDRRVRTKPRATDPPPRVHLFRVL